MHMEDLKCIVLNFAFITNAGSTYDIETVDVSCVLACIGKSDGKLNERSLPLEKTLRNDTEAVAVVVMLQAVATIRDSKRINT